jgi:hypothetical protein
LPLLALKKAMRASSTDLPISKEEGLLSCMDPALSTLSLQAHACQHSAAQHIMSVLRHAGDVRSTKRLVGCRPCTIW